jgi:D-3-phosphoglycerate dehydrogenase
MKMPSRIMPSFWRVRVASGEETSSRLGGSILTSASSQAEELDGTQGRGLSLHVFSPAEIEEHVRGADAFVAGIREQYTREVLQAAERLKVGCSTIIGTENIDVDGATELGIVIGFGATPENYLGVAGAAVT